MVKKTLDQLNAKQLRAILNFYNLSPPDTLDVSKLLQLLRYCDGYTTVFGSLKLTNVVANFAPGSLLQLYSKDGQVVVNCTQVPNSSNCTSCQKEVLSDNSALGQGLECSNCESWFHNQCHSSPISLKLYGLLAASPNYLEALCPPCQQMSRVSQHKLFTEIQSLKAQFTGIKEAFQVEFAEIKKALVFEQLKDHIEHVLEKETVQNLSQDIYKEMTTITTSSHEMKASLDNTLIAVDDVAGQMVQSVQRMNELNMEDLSSNITGLSQTVADFSVRSNSRKTVW